MSDQKDGWRPIESAPKDGTRIIVWLADEGFGVVAHWREVQEENSANWWGWFLPESDETMTECAFHDISHWMPFPSLPPPPGDDT